MYGYLMIDGHKLSISDGDEFFVELDGVSLPKVNDSWFLLDKPFLQVIKHEQHINVEYGPGIGIYYYIRRSDFRYCEEFEDIEESKKYLSKSSLKSARIH